MRCFCFFLSMVCKQLRDMTVVSNVVGTPQSKMYKLYTKQTLTLKSIDAEIALQDMEVQEA